MSTLRRPVRGGQTPQRRQGGMVARPGSPRRPLRSWERPGARSRSPGQAHESAHDEAPRDACRHFTPRSAMVSRFPSAASSSSVTTSPPSEGSPCRPSSPWARPGSRPGGGTISPLPQPIADSGSSPARASAGPARTSGGSGLLGGAVGSRGTQRVVRIETALRHKGLPLLHDCHLVSKPCPLRLTSGRSDEPDKFPTVPVPPPAHTRRGGLQICDQASTTSRRVRTRRLAHPEARFVDACPTPTTEATSVAVRIR